MSRQSIKQHTRWVVKVGSALLTADGQGLDSEMIVSLAKQINELRESGVEVVLVSSGSVVAGMSKLAMLQRPDKMNDLQAAAAVGQASLVRHYETAFEPYGICIAQVLLTHADIANRERYLNAKNTLRRLLSLGVMTVINENDTVATDEICFGDNDSLAALVTNLVEADLMVVLTDQNGLYTADPRQDSKATLLHEVDANDDSLMAMASGGTSLGRGGMVTKLQAAQRASRSGASTIIANGRQENVLQAIQQGEQVGTLLAGNQRLASKKQWMAGQMHSSGSLVLDKGAIEVLTGSGKSLLPVGVLSVNGTFQRGELVSCLDGNGVELARGLTNYSSAEADSIKGMSSQHIASVLGYGGEDELIHRDNMVVF